MTAATALRELLVVAKNARAQSYSETLLSDVLDYLERLALDGLAGPAFEIDLTKPIEDGQP